MNIKYDSEQIRQLAARIGRAAEAVSDVNTSDLKGIKKETPTHFQGSAATALQEAVGNLMTDVSSISTSLYELRAALLQLAAKVEEIDRNTASMISGD